MMKRRTWIAGVGALVAVIGLSGALQAATKPGGSATARTKAAPAEPPLRIEKAPLVNVRMQTSLGVIVFEIDAGHAPLTASNFLRYVDQKRLDDSTFYRAMKVGDSGELGLVQGGLRGNPKRVFRPIGHEPTSATGLSHVSGALSMARAAPGTAQSDFFIIIGDLTTLDAHEANPATGVDADLGYAVFGRVVEGMDVVRAILEQPVSDAAPVAAMKGQMLARPVTIVSARRVPATAATAAGATDPGSATGPAP